MTEEKLSGFDKSLNLIHKVVKAPAANTLLHRMAMELSDAARFSFMYDREPETTRMLNQAATALEAVCADHLKERGDVQPTRGVLYRSAATLARRCGNFEECIRLVTEGKRKNAPGYIMNELGDIEKSLCQDLLWHSRVIKETEDGGIKFEGSYNFDWFDIDVPDCEAVRITKEVVTESSDWLFHKYRKEWYSHDMVEDLLESGEFRKEDLCERPEVSS